MSATTYTTVTAAAHVTDEILAIAWEVVEGWHDNGGPIEWSDVWDRMDGQTLADGTRLDLGGSIDSPALRKIQRAMRAMLKDA